VKNAYSPLVDLAASPNLGAKRSCLCSMGFYCGRKWRTYPLHFPNPPFNNPTEPYENPHWPASVLASLDGVALDSVGLDLLLAQTKNNDDADGHPRILIRINADDHLFEMGPGGSSSSGTVYLQGGKRVSSLGVHERWDSDVTMRYSRNLDPVNGKGIELLYLPIGAETRRRRHRRNLCHCPPAGCGWLDRRPTDAAGGVAGPRSGQHDFLYAGEAKTRDIYIVRGGKIAWSEPVSGPPPRSSCSTSPRRPKRPFRQREVTHQPLGESAQKPASRMGWLSPRC